MSDNKHPFGMAQADDIFPNRTPGPREVLFRTQMEPLVEQLKELANAAGIPALMAFELDTHDLPDVGDAIVCHVAAQGGRQDDGTYLPPRHPGMLVAGNVLGANPRPELVMIGKIMRSANAQERTGGPCDCTRCMARREQAATAERTGVPAPPEMGGLFADVPLKPTTIPGLSGGQVMVSEDDPTRSRGPRERAYDSNIRPLVNQVIEASKAIGAPALVMVELDADSPGESIVAIAAGAGSKINDARMLGCLALARGEVSSMPPEMVTVLLRAKEHIEEDSAKECAAAHAARTN